MLHRLVSVETGVLTGVGAQAGRAAGEEGHGRAWAPLGCACCVASSAHRLYSARARSSMTA